MSHNEILVPCSRCPNWIWVSGAHLADTEHEDDPVTCEWCGSQYRFSLHGETVKDGEWPNKAHRDRIAAHAAATHEGVEK